MLAEVDIPNDGRLRPGMYARVTITLAVHRGALSIPTESILGKESERFVYTVVDGKAKKTPVTVGVDDGKTAEMFGLENGVDLKKINVDTDAVRAFVAPMGNPSRA